MSRFQIYLFRRLKEPSTWRGMIALMAALGIVLDPEQVEAIIAFGLAGIGAIGAFFPDLVPEGESEQEQERNDYDAV